MRPYFDIIPILSRAAAGGTTNFWSGRANLYGGAPDANMHIGCSVVQGDSARPCVVIPMLSSVEPLELLEGHAHT